MILSHANNVCILHYDDFMVVLDKKYMIFKGEGIMIPTDNRCDNMHVLNMINQSYE